MKLGFDMTIFRSKFAARWLLALLALGVLVLLLVPYFKQLLLNVDVEMDVDRETAVSDQAAMNQV